MCLLAYLFNNTNITLQAQQHKYYPTGSSTQILAYWLNNTNIFLLAQQRKYYPTGSTP